MFSILKAPDCNILTGLTQEQFKEIRETCISCILDTDMSFHFKNVSKLQSRINSGSFFGRIDSERIDDDRMMLCSIILHTADISNGSAKGDFI